MKTVMKFLSVVLLISSVVKAVDVEVDDLSLIHRRTPGSPKATASFAQIVNATPQHCAEAKVAYDPTPGPSGFAGVLLVWPDAWFAIEPNVVCSVKAPTNVTSSCDGEFFIVQKDAAITNASQTGIVVLKGTVDGGLTCLSPATLADGLELECFAEQLV